MTRIRQFIYYGEDDDRNFPSNIQYTDLQNGQIFINPTHGAIKRIKIIAPSDINDYDCYFYLNECIEPITTVDQHYEL